MLHKWKKPTRSEALSGKKNLLKLQIRHMKGCIVFQRHMGPLGNGSGKNLTVYKLDFGINCITVCLKLLFYSIFPKKYQPTQARTFTLATNSSVPHTETVTVKQTVSKLVCNLINELKSSMKVLLANVYFLNR